MPRLLSTVNVAKFETKNISETKLTKSPAKYNFSMHVFECNHRIHFNI